METDEYNKIVKNIHENPKFELKEAQLYRIKEDKLLKVIQKHEVEGLLYMMHDHELSAHFGIKAIQDKIRGKYWWNKMMKDIENYVKSCDRCQRRNKPQGKNELSPISVKTPFYQIGIDFVGPLPATKKRNRYIIVAMDYFTKWPEARATKRDTAEEVVKFLYEDIICRHGCPRKIISDRGKHFDNKMVELLTKKFEIKHNLSTSYHPQTNGLVERFNKTLCESLAKLQEDKQWDDKIPSVLFAYRNKTHSSTKTKPFYLVYGRKANFIEEETQTTERLNEIIEGLPFQRNIAKEEILRSQVKQKEYHDSRSKRKEEFKIGDEVLRYNAAQQNSKSNKLDDKWSGLYLIHEILLNGSYKLKELDGKILRNPTNGELLKRYFTRELR
ncbi:protein NYNRIN-like [Rhizophagus irregularis DAOM 181602=DAOM 197198]|nr:protein NYNRIN-like [Rhizophagus irregularis DAOM 181602=DAOM 197198]